MNTRLLAIPALSLLALLASNPAVATNLWDPSVSTTRTLDGSSVRLDGTINVFAPWVAELYAEPGNCVRFFVTSTTFDSELTVIAPNGTVYRDDDSGGLARPLVKIDGAPVQGWYTVQVGHFSGEPVNQNFTLLYGRYSAGNPNCAGGTLPQTFGADAAVKDVSASDPMAPKHPTAPESMPN